MVKMLMFKKVLIANRGEIACRIIKTLKRLKIRSVAVFSEADKHALHVNMADEAVYIGESLASDSYLNSDSIIEAITKTGADAVHPGYGFMSENADFANRISEIGVNFIGPSADVISVMGDKITSKKIAQKANVNTIPGYLGEIKDEEEAQKISEEIGFPIIIKAAAGGGGKGMRVVEHSSELGESMESAINEAVKSFKDGRVFIEKYITKPRHIEIQILADKHGNVLCLGERECSIQRNNQKVIEECPSSFISDKVRQEMYIQCKKLVKDVGYFSAGTIEFVVDSNMNFYFLEMNTRLQVEHPVTELVIGIDLVEYMLRVAIGEKLDFSQEDVTFNGWAMESRIYSEDPSKGFLPATGCLLSYVEPESSEENGIRVDAGVRKGSEISMYYDPMISKLITHGKDRLDAIEKMRQALSSYIIEGVITNLDFLEAVMYHENFVSGDITTNFIKEFFPKGFKSRELTDEHRADFISVSMYIYICSELSKYNIFRNDYDFHKFSGKWNIIMGKEAHDITVEAVDDKSIKIFWNDREFCVSGSLDRTGLIFRGSINDKDVCIKVSKIGIGYELKYQGVMIFSKVFAGHVADFRKFMPIKMIADNSHVVKSPITGRIAKIFVKIGDMVKVGQTLVTIEAMKMENKIVAEEDERVIAEIKISEEAVVNVGDELILYEKGV